MRQILKRYRLLPIVCICLHGVVVLAHCEAASNEPVDRLNLQACVDIALQNQPAIHARRSALDAANAQRDIAQSYSYPQVDLGVRYTALDEPLTVATPNPIQGPAADVFSDSAAYFAIARQAGPAAADAALANPNGPLFSQAKQAALTNLPSFLQTDLLGASFLTTHVTMTQAIWTGGKIRYRQQQAGLGVQLGAQDIRKSQQETIFNVTRAYQGILLAEELLRVAERTQAKFAAIEQVAQGMVEQGDEYVSVPDMLRPRVLSNLAMEERLKLLNSRDLAYAALKQSMGVEQEYGFTIADSNLQLDNAQVDYYEIADQALRRRPEILKSRIAVKLATLERELAEAQFSPDIGLYANFTSIVDDQDFANPTNPNIGAAGVNLALPLITGGRRQAQVCKAEFDRRQARRVQELVQQMIVLESQQAYLDYRELSERVTLSEASVRHARQALEAYEKQFGDTDDADMPKYFENVVTTRLLLTQAEVNRHQVVFGYNVAVAKIRLVSASN
jgi:outer membrane protein TolC